VSAREAAPRTADRHTSPALAVRLPAELRAWWTAHAEAEGRPLNAIVAELMTERAAALGYVAGEHAELADAEHPLTAAQQRILDRVRAEGPLVLGGRRRRAIEALERRGLVTAVYDATPQAKGSGIELVQRITVTAVTEATRVNGQGGMVVPPPLLYLMQGRGAARTDGRETRS
jgi:hypothetical protein